MDEPRKLHPVMWVAAVSVTILSAVGIAAITGVLPHAGGQSAEPARIEAAAPQPVPVAAPAATLAPAPAPVVAAPAPTAPAVAEPAPLPPKVVKHHKPVHLAQAETMNKAYPPSDAVAPPPGTPYPPEVRTPPPCPDCGIVESVKAIQQKGQGSGLGAIAGGVVGGLLGNQVGAGHGRDLATVVGAVAGGFAGNEVEKTRKTTSQYQVVVRFEDGTSRVITQQSAPPWQAGDRVKVVNGEVLPR